MSATALRDQIVTALEDLKGQNIQALDVSRLTSITDFMVLVSARSNRHVKAMVDDVLEAAKAYGQPAIGVEGRENYEWVLLDLGDVVVHVMQQQAREFYDLERLWSDAGTDSEKTTL